MMQAAQDMEGGGLNSPSVVKNFLTTKEIIARFPVFSTAKLYRLRKHETKNVCGHSLKWYVIAGFYYLEESELIEWLNGCTVSSEIVSSSESRVKMLESARAAKATKRRQQTKVEF